MCDVIAETLFSVRLHSCKKQLRKRFLKNITSSPEYEDSVYECQKNFSEENTDSDIEELNDLIGNLHPYCCKPEKVASKSSRSDSDTNDKESSEEENISPNSVEINWAEH